MGRPKKGNWLRLKTIHVAMPQILIDRIDHCRKRTTNKARGEFLRDLIESTLYNDRDFCIYMARLCRLQELNWEMQSQTLATKESYITTKQEGDVK